MLMARCEDCGNDFPVCESATAHGGEPDELICACPICGGISLEPYERNSYEQD